MLFKSMHDAGYCWDADTLTLMKKVLDVEIPFGAKDSELVEETITVPEGCHAIIEGNQVVIRKGEQPAMYDGTFEASLRHVMEEAIECGDTHNVKADADMLLRLARRNAEWADEDKQNLSCLWDILAVHRSTNPKVDDLMEWIKGLVPNPNVKIEVMINKERAKTEIESLRKHYLDREEYDIGYNKAIDDAENIIDSMREEPLGEGLNEE